MMTKKQFKEKVITLKLLGKITYEHFQSELEWLNSKGNVDQDDLEWLEEKFRE